MWLIQQTERFENWYHALKAADRENVLTAIFLLHELGPMLTRPYADTLNGSRHRNMKELRIQSQGRPIRAFYAFDPHRNGILLCAGDKGGNDKHFYDVMIPIADQEYAAHLKNLI
ncbi:type II toxin-antitoxin system RelE/ParE family toxin [Vreelandella jeotgali]|uniref:type II toxin-antitoxin system RelE/ParE family toxin n=1 Tax=Vreelandella jeotgali TaxID=553386 RepID=UPI00034C212F|nr:type II toxin-antitoxin system RelE/ParE family toxin [Halomonas jeotgali]